MPTEEDTFRKLKRPDFVELERRIHLATKHVGNKAAKEAIYLAVLKLCDWTRDEYIVAHSQTLDRIFSPKKRV